MWPLSLPCESPLRIMNSHIAMFQSVIYDNTTFDDVEEENVISNEKVKTSKLGNTLMFLEHKKLHFISVSFNMINRLTRFFDVSQFLPAPLFPLKSHLDGLFL